MCPLRPGVGDGTASRWRMCVRQGSVVQGVGTHRPRPSRAIVWALLDSGSLPSARGTRQRPNCTWQSLYRVRHSAKNTRQKIDRQRPLCRESRGHSAKKSDHHGTESVDGGFAECQPCRHSAKIFLFLFFKNSLPSVLWPALGKV